MITFSAIKLFLKPLIIDLSIDFFISTIPLFNNNNNNNEKFTILATIEECFLGEVYNDMISSCVKCPWGSYSFNKLDKTCKNCPNEATFCFGNIVFLKNGFWRSTNFDILPCKPNSASCLFLFFSFLSFYILFYLLGVEMNLHVILDMMVRCVNHAFMVEIYHFRKMALNV